MWRLASLLMLAVATGLAAAYHTPVGETNAESAETTQYGGKTAEWVSTWSKPISVAADPRSGLRIFCWPGVKRNIKYLLYSAFFRLDIPNDSFHLYLGSSSEQVAKQYKASSRWFSLLPWRARTIRLSPFSPTCLGITTSQMYTLTLVISPVDALKFLGFVGGIALMLLARRMSRNTFFHYSSGISIALVGSLLVAIFLISRMIPRRAAGVSFLVGGWAVVLYFFQTLWKNFRETVLQHSGYVATYVLVVSIITFFIIYRFGGVKNPRTMDIIQWFLQICGAGLIYWSCNIEEIAGLVIIALIALEVLLQSGYNFRNIRLFNKLFPPRPRRLLTQDEYEEIGRRQTIKELQKLRQFANSPQCKSWQVVKRLSNPSRFGSFVEDGTHLSFDETDAYDREMTLDGEDLDERSGGGLRSNGWPSPQSYSDTSFSRNLNSGSPRKLAGGEGSGLRSRTQWRDSRRSMHDGEPMDYD